MNRIKKLITLFAFSMLVLGLPTLASAQWRDRDRNDDDDYRTDRNGDYRNNQRYNRNLQSTIKNLKNRSKEFARRLDRELDRSRYDDRRREDQLNRLAQSFKNAADDLDDVYDNRRDSNRSETQAQRVIQLGNQLDSALYRARLNYSLQNDWNRIRQDLNTLSNAYRYNNRNDRNNRNNSDWKNRFPWPF
ncbi:MAG: hypothetical protein IPN69_23480 [Acidobacteria bacterium]|nr:hypothetical protein [Acidobacteriota bacterium]MBK8151011.1 hypothetical protein [Acidobacteriota bacterium]MBK8813672.1 hypothetical protein [Acidobacteriota bacterium]